MWSDAHKVTEGIMCCNYCPQEYKYTSSTTNMLNHLKGKHIGKFFIDSIGESGNCAGSSGMSPGLPWSVTTGNYFSGISDAKVPHMVQTGLTIIGAFA